MDAINRGDQLVLRNAFGQRVPGRALSGVMAGSRDAIVWVCAEDDWPEFSANPDHQAGVPWPIEAIEVPTSV